MQIQISWLLQKPTDLDLHCLQRQGISRFSRTRVKWPMVVIKSLPILHHSAVLFFLFSLGSMGPFLYPWKSNSALASVRRHIAALQTTLLHLNILRQSESLTSILSSVQCFQCQTQILLDCTFDNKIRSYAFKTNLIILLNTTYAKILIFSKKCIIIIELITIKES